MSEPFLLDELVVTGFRAFLDRQTFDFRQKRSLAVFAPNGSGKSSLVDAVEFMFSDEGTLDRLGLREIHNQAGIRALAHNRAADRKLTAGVTVTFSHGETATSGTRLASGKNRPIPDIAADVKAAFAVNPIIRGHSLRQFVETQTAEQRYEELAGWLGLDILVMAQRNLRALRQLAKAASTDRNRLDRIDEELGRKTKGTVSAWDDAAIVEYINAQIGPLDAKLAFASFERRDDTYEVLNHRREAEEKRAGLAGLRQLRDAIAALTGTGAAVEGGQGDLGLIRAFEDEASMFRRAAKAEAAARKTVANAVFEDLWAAAETLLAQEGAVTKDCPLCGTPLDRSAVGSLAGLQAHIEAHRREVAAFTAAKRTLAASRKGARTSLERLALGVRAAAALVDDEAGLRRLLDSYASELAAWKEGSPPKSAESVAALDALKELTDSQIKRIEKRQGEHTYAKALGQIDTLFGLSDERELASQVLVELESLSSELDRQAAIVSGQIRGKVEKLLDRLQEPVNRLYALVQGGKAIPIRIELPSEDDTNQQRLVLVVDFAPNRQGVAPAGYLSDSQVHTLALALRLVAIREFNRHVPLIVLDDVVTSYDVDHRRAIAAMFEQEFEGSQLLVMTHEERFFAYLKDQLPHSSWQFKRIIRCDADYGPRFVDQVITDQEIEDEWNRGKSAANLIRQAEEEWLLGICRDFGTEIRIRTVERALSYDRAELASALAGFLTGAKLKPPPVPGVANRFLTSLQSGVVENFGSHFQDAPFGSGSAGDERTRWNEFRTFRAYFACPKCLRRRFKRPVGLSRPVCMAENCETHFDFAVPQRDATGGGTG